MERGEAIQKAKQSQPTPKNPSDEPRTAQSAGAEPWFRRRARTLGALKACAGQAQ